MLHSETKTTAASRSAVKAERMWRDWRSMAERISGQAKQGTVCRRQAGSLLHRLACLSLGTHNMSGFLDSSLLSQNFKIHLVSENKALPGDPCVRESAGITVPSSVYARVFATPLSARKRSLAQLGKMYCDFTVPLRSLRSVDCPALCTRRYSSSHDMAFISPSATFTSGSSHRHRSCA